MPSPLARIITNEIYRVRTRTKRKPELKPSEIPSLLGYTARLTQVKWDRLKARRSHG
ncbi:NinE family protein [Escherichia coli]